MCYRRCVRKITSAYPSTPIQIKPFRKGISSAATALSLCACHTPANKVQGTVLVDVENLNARSILVWTYPVSVSDVYVLDI